MLLFFLGCLPSSDLFNVFLSFSHSLTLITEQSENWSFVFFYFWSSIVDDDDLPRLWAFFHSFFLFLTICLPRGCVCKYIIIIIICPCLCYLLCIYHHYFYYYYYENIRHTEPTLDDDYHDHYKNVHFDDDDDVTLIIIIIINTNYSNNKQFCGESVCVKLWKLLLSRLLIENKISQFKNTEQNSQKIVRLSMVIIHSHFDSLSKVQLDGNNNKTVHYDDLLLKSHNHILFSIPWMNELLTCFSLSPNCLFCFGWK